MQRLVKIGHDIVSQLEVLHMLGVVHGDLKFQNLCYNKVTNSYSIIDFALVTKLYHSNGRHREQKKISNFYGNSLFASEAMIELKTTGRKDDLESLMYVLCFLS